ncbi:C40 family peptidase [Bifidobacterium coryneforme]|uniref:C40 family peptidase n=1 Tax=Bifidobacterium coryneforme TaxID=1687 RepID=UPI00068D3819|nr:C40 family peptidase [Bifidobacterium coryneforme]
MKANLLDESISTTVEKDSNWGGIESLDVPVTKSQAEKDAEARQAARAAQAAQAAQNAQTRNQSGVASRSSQRATQQVAVDDAPVTGTGQDVVSYAMQFQGVPYVFGGETPSGFDCSGFTKYVFAHFGIALPHNADAQAGFGTPVSTPAPGDLMVAPGHVAIYVGNGYMIHAPAPGQTVKVQAPYRSFEYRRLV